MINIVSRVFFLLVVPLVLAVWSKPTSLEICLQIQENKRPILTMGGQGVSEKDPAKHHFYLLAEGGYLFVLPYRNLFLNTKLIIDVEYKNACALYNEPEIEFRSFNDNKTNGFQLFGLISNEQGKHFLVREYGSATRTCLKKYPLGGGRENIQSSCEDNTEARTVEHFLLNNDGDAKYTLSRIVMILEADKKYTLKRQMGDCIFEDEKPNLGLFSMVKGFFGILNIKFDEFEKICKKIPNKIQTGFKAGYFNNIGAFLSVDRTVSIVDFKTSTITREIALNKYVDCVFPEKSETNGTSTSINTLNDTKQADKNQSNTWQTYLSLVIFFLALVCLALLVYESGFRKSKQSRKKKRVKQKLRDRFKSPELSRMLFGPRRSPTPVGSRASSNKSTIKSKRSESSGSTTNRNKSALSSLASVKLQTSNALLQSIKSLFDPLKKWLKKDKKKSTLQSNRSQDSDSTSNRNGIFSSLVSVKSRVSSAVQGSVKSIFGPPQKWMNRTKKKKGRNKKKVTRQG